MVPGSIENLAQSPASAHSAGFGLLQLPRKLPPGVRTAWGALRRVQRGESQSLCAWVQRRIGGQRQGLAQRRVDDIVLVARVIEARGRPLPGRLRAMNDR
jgi:hypothetical protein